MALAIICPNANLSRWVRALRAIEPGLDVRVWPEVGHRDEVEYVLTWGHPPGELRKYKNLKCVSSMGAGVDHLLNDPALPSGVPVVRLVDSSLIRSMTEYVVLAVLHHYRQFDQYKVYQAQKRWGQKILHRGHDTCIGIMGLGQLGREAGLKLSSLGLRVIGWSRTPKDLAGIESYAGDDQLSAFLARSQILVCLLPLTPATRGILNRETFDRLPRGAYLINVARGDHLVDEDLIEALDSGHLSGACLDVFRVEPLPEDHPFWEHPKIRMTPHISSVTDPDSVAPQIVENYRRARTGQPLLNQVDLERGY